LIFLRFYWYLNYRSVSSITTTKTSWMFIVLAHWNNRPRVDMSLHFDRLFWFWASQSLLFLHTVLVWPDRCSNTQPTALEASTPNRYAIDGVMRPQCFLLFFFYNYDSLNTCFLVFILLFIYLFLRFFVDFFALINNMILYL
jgi:hypothetical protein